MRPARSRPRKAGHGRCAGGTLGAAALAAAATRGPGHGRAWLLPEPPAAPNPVWGVPIPRARPEGGGRNVKAVTSRLCRQSEEDSPAARPSRLRRALPCGDGLDKQIAKIAVPSMANLLILPLVNAIDTYWVGQMGNALALAGQGAANQVFSSIFWIIAFLPSVITPLVAQAAASGKKDEARNRVCEAGFLAATMGVLGTVMLGLFTPFVLQMVLAPGAPAEAYALPYLRIRALSFVPALLSTVGFAAFRGVMDTVTPLRVVLFSNLLNIVLDPVLMFGCGMGVVGAAVATVVAEVVACIAYSVLLFRKRLVTLRSLFRVPEAKRIGMLLQGGAAVQARSFALNAAFVTATRRAQAMDGAGVSAAAYAISLQFWQLGGVVLFALQSSASILVPAQKAKKEGGARAARDVADRLLILGLALGMVVAAGQLLALPLLSAFSTLPSVSAAARTPVLIASFMSVIAGVVFAGEGIMMGRSAWGSLAKLAAVSCGAMVLGIQLVGGSWGLNGIWFSIMAFNLVNLFGVLWHHFVATPRKEAEKGGES